jgi:hypothetical protein
MFCPFKKTVETEQAGYAEGRRQPMAGWKPAKKRLKLNIVINMIIVY